jgi:hypothetical protein
MKMPLHLLLDSGADTSVKDKRGQSALHVAVTEGSAQSVRTLLLYGADIDGINRKGLTPLSEAMVRGDETIIQILLLVEATEFLETMRTDIDVADMIFCPQRLDDLMGVPRPHVGLISSMLHVWVLQALPFYLFPDLYVWLLPT